MRPFKNIFFSFIFLLIPLITNAQTTEVSFQNRLYKYSKGEYTLMSGNREFNLVQDNVVVKLKNNIQLEDIQFSNYDLPKLTRAASTSNNEYYLLKIPGGNDLLTIFEKLKNTNLFELIESNVYAKYLSAPDDDYYISQSHWNLDKLEMEKAWNIIHGSSQLKVAVIGGGVEYDHEDLIDQLNTDYKGWNYATGTEDPSAYTYHETNCAGIIAASTNNDLGVAGIAGGWNGGGIKMMYFQCQPNQFVEPTSFNVGDAILKARTATGGGAKVISISLSLPFLSSLNTQIDNAYNAGVIICVAAGNTERTYDDKTHQWVIDGDETVTFPASNQNVISIGASIQDDHRKTMAPSGQDWASNYNGHLDLVAPGISIPTTHLIGFGGKYRFDFAGTSAAAPHVAGVAALVLSINPSLPPDTVRKILTESGDFESFMNQNEYGGGRLNAYQALKYTLEHYGGTISQSFTIPSGETWNFQPGVTVKFGSNVSLTVNGVLNATGTSSQPITFTAKSGTSPSSWGTIKLNGSGASGSVIKYANISYGTQVDVYNVPDFEISNCNFTDNYKAVYVYNSEGLISNSNITSSSIGHVIETANASTLDCRNNNITKSNHNGFAILYGGGSDGYATGNDISGCDVGIGIIWSSSSSSYSSTYLPKNNRIRNCNDGFKVYRLGSGLFGHPPSGSNDARNSIYGNKKRFCCNCIYNIRS